MFDAATLQKVLDAGEDGARLSEDVTTRRLAARRQPREKYIVSDFDRLAEIRVGVAEPLLLTLDAPQHDFHFICRRCQCRTRGRTGWRNLTEIGSIDLVHVLKLSRIGQPHPAPHHVRHFEYC